MASEVFWLPCENILLEKRGVIGCDIGARRLKGTEVWRFVGAAGMLSVVFKDHIVYHPPHPTHKTILMPEMAFGLERV